jgi:hypothetical protein
VFLDIVSSTLHHILFSSSFKVIQALSLDGGTTADKKVCVFYRTVKYRCEETIVDSKREGGHYHNNMKMTQIC